MEPMTDMSSQYASQEWWGDGNPHISHSNSHLTKGVRSERSDNHRQV